MEMVKAYLEHYGRVLKFAWEKVIKVVFYIVFMWGFLVTALFLFLEDFWKAAGIVSAIILFRITQTEFYKEYYGTRLPEDRQHAVQKQGKR